MWSDPSLINAYFALETDILLLTDGVLAERSGAPQHAADRAVRAPDRQQRQHVVEQQKRQVVSASEAHITSHHQMLEVSSSSTD